MILNNMILIIFLIILNNTNANYIQHDKIVAKNVNSLILESTVKKNIDILKILTLHKNKIDLKKKVLTELAIINTYPNSIRKYNIHIDQDSIKSLYKDLSEKYSMNIKNFRKFIVDKYKINDYALISFILRNLTINKIQKSIFYNDLVMSNNDIKDFFETSNYIKQKKLLSDFKILQLSFNKNTYKSLKELKSIIKILRNTNNLEKIKNELHKNITIKIIDINQNNKKLTFLKDFIENKKNETLYGPLYIGKHLHLFKIIDTIQKVENYKPYIKICVKTINKKKINDILNKKKHTDPTFNNKTYWVYKDNIDSSIYEQIKKLKVGEISDTIETQTGWYILKIIDKTFDQKTNIYNYIEERIIIEKIKLLTHDLIQKNIKAQNLEF